MKIAYHRPVGIQSPKFLGASCEGLSLRRLRRRVPPAPVCEAPPNPQRLEPRLWPTPLAEIGSRWPLLRAVPYQARARGHGQRPGCVRTPGFAGPLESLPVFFVHTRPCHAHARCCHPRSRFSATLPAPHPSSGLARSPCSFRPSGRALHAESAPGCGAVEACCADAAIRRDVGPGTASAASPFTCQRTDNWP